MIRRVLDSVGEVHAAPSSVKVPGRNATAAARSNGRITKLTGDLCSRSTHASWSILVETDVIVEYLRYSAHCHERKRRHNKGWSLTCAVHTQLTSLQLLGLYSGNTPGNFLSRQITVDLRRAEGSTTTTEVGGGAAPPHSTCIRGWSGWCVASMVASVEHDGALSSSSSRDAR